MHGYVSGELVDQSLQILCITKDSCLIDDHLIIDRFLKGDIHDKKRIEAKNFLLINHFDKPDVVSLPPIKIYNQCPECLGRGFHANLLEIKEEKCTFCIDGWHLGPCRRCKGTGNVDGKPCGTCYDYKEKKGRRTYLYKRTYNHDGSIHYPGILCKVCKGTEKIKKLVLNKNTRIESVSYCESCDAIGIIQKIGTTVLSEQFGLEAMKKYKLKSEN